jgi:hypothetical protein
MKARDADAPYRVWGADFEPDALRQMTNACKLPVAVAGALMPDAHVGYGLPIGGVLATHEAVIPYAVGVDIACRMKMTVLDLPLSTLTDERGRLAQAIERETRFGMGATFKSPRQHEVMDRDWRVSVVTSKMKDRAWSQLGTSGSGNHFVEFGELTVLKRGGRPSTRDVPRAPQPFGKPRHRRAGSTALQPARTRVSSRAAERTVTPRMARPVYKRRAGVLGGNGADGPIRGSESRTDS